MMTVQELRDSLDEIDGDTLVFVQTEDGEFIPLDELWDAFASIDPHFGNIDVHEEEEEEDDEPAIVLRPII